MCILCVIQKWSRKIATMLPWLVIPLIGLWALSQLLPPAFRFEITSSRLACVLVLLVTLFWYEVLMPQLSAWQIRREARLRERKRTEAIELQKLRKTATRRCRNCYTAYRDQNPGGGKFMCSYCGHISKRPVLDLPVLPGMHNSGILKDLVTKGGKMLNGKAWSDNGWVCGQELLENGSWSSGPPFTGKSSSYWQKNGGNLYGGDDEHCLTGRSCSRILVFACRALARIFFWRKLFRVGSSGDDASADTECRGMMDNCGENGVSGQESRGERSRRKAEEKRLARLEKELLEEEERKQREEVARLIEERRKLRDEKMEAEKEHRKVVSPVKASDGKKESERKRREKKKEKDRGSSKSNSDAEEVEKRTIKENERNKSESDRQEQHRKAGESLKSHGAELGSGLKVAAASNHSRGNAGTRYFDRMRGTFLSSSRAFAGGGFFGKSANTSTISREHKPNTYSEPTPSSTFGKDSRSISTANGDNKSVCHPVLVEAQPNVSPKKSWQQLFTRSSAVSPPLSSNAISRPTVQSKTTVQSPTISGHPTSTHSTDNPINFGLSSPFSLPSFSFGSSGNSTAISLSSEPVLSKTNDLPHQYFSEEPEIFEDPCYDPDPISLLGPVSESLDEFQRDLGYVTKAKPSEAAKPSPIEAPFSRSRVLEERHSSSFPFPGSTIAQDNPNCTSDAGTWQMWNTTPLVQDGLGLIGGPSSWLLPPGKNPINEDITNSVPQRTMASLFKNDEQVSSGTQPPQNVQLGSFQSGGKTFNDPVHAIMGDPWLPEPLFGPALIHENQVLLKSKEEGVQNGLIFGNPSDSAANTWDRNDWAVQGAREASRPPAGSFYSSTDVQSLWSRN